MPFTTKWNWEEEVQMLTKLSASGMTLTAIAEKYDVSKQRIKQVFEKYHIPQIGLRKQKKDKEYQWQQKWGAKSETDSELYDAQREKFRRKKANAIRCGVEFSVSFGELDWPKYCPVLGLEIDYFSEKRGECSPSFDKVDPEKGYVSGNVKIISWRANRIKNDGSADEHLKIAAYIAASSAA